MDKYIKLETVTNLIDNALEQLKNTSGELQPIVYSNNVPQAHWLADPIDELFVDWECSNCHKYALINSETHGPFRSAYCPYCGAKMDGETNG